MSWKKVKLKQILKQYRIEHLVQNDIEYKQVTISKYDGVTFRGTKMGREIGRKRQFQIDLKQYPNTLMFVRQGVQDGSIGIAPIEVDGCIATENMPMFSIEGINLEYLKFLLKSPYFYDELNKIQTTGSAQKSIHEREILEIEIPFPEIVEQEEIVLELSKKKDNSLEISTELSHQLNLVKKLRQQLLQDAVQGKLVPQNPNDEPASELLKKIKAEKQKLIAEGKLKKEKELPPINAEEIPFKIPKNWVWCRFENLCSHIFDMEHQMPTAVSNGGIMFLSAKDLIDNGKINYTDNVKHISEEDYNYLTRNFTPQKNDIIYSRRGANLGKSRIVDTDLKYLASYSCCTIRTLNPCLDYINYLLDGGFILSQATKHTTNNSIPDLGVNKIKSFIVPLPPLNEQKRIVQQINDLMQTCDALETSIKESAEQNEKLLQQVLREALRKEEVGA